MKFSAYLMAALVLLAPHLQAQDKAVQIPESIDLAKTVPIADVHMHLVDRSAAFHKEQMDRNKVQWGGGVGPTGKNPPNHKEIQNILGKRYFYGLGQAEFTKVFLTAGADGLVNLGNREFAEMFKTADSLFETKQAYGFGELHIDNSNSAPNPRFGRQIGLNNPVTRAMYVIANKHSGFMQFHMEMDEGNIKALEAFIEEFPNVKTILSHGLPRANQNVLRSLLEKHPNLYLELSRKGSVLTHRENAQAFSIRNGPKDMWLKTIELFPDRFMIGSDTHDPDESKYDEVMQEFRAGLFPYLKPETLKNVAYMNAVRVFKLTY